MVQISTSKSKYFSSFYYVMSHVTDIGAMVSYIFTYRDSRTIRMLGCDVHN